MAKLVKACARAAFSRLQTENIMCDPIGFRELKWERTSLFNF